MNTVPRDRSRLLDRRNVLIGAGAAGLGLAAGMTMSPAFAATPTASTALPVLTPDDDWGQVLAATPQVQLVPGAAYTLTKTVALPDNTFIEGNGAIVTVADDSTGALSADQKIDVTVRNVTFQGRTADPLGTAPSFAHVAIRLSRCTDFRVLDCDFNYWLGAGIVVTGSTSDDYFSYRGHVTGNTFHHCYFGVSFADRAEYSALSGNVFTRNRLAIWNSSGNLTATGNVVVACYGAYYSFAATSPYGSQASDNWAHGNVVGNTFNHSNGSGGVRWTGNAGFPIGGSNTDPGAGVVVSGVIPPTFSSNTLWYTNVTARNHAANAWFLTGCALSDLTVSATGANPIKIVGYQCNAGHAPTLAGTVQSVL
ncbi:hypothetical protein GCM10028798_24510 [Humibacter antri]